MQPVLTILVLVGVLASYEAAKGKSITLAFGRKRDINNRHLFYSEKDQIPDVQKIS